MISIGAALPRPQPLDIGGVTVMTYTFGAHRDDARGDVVFCHGTPWSAQVWASAARYLSSGYRVFLWDTPGYGASPKRSDVPVDLIAQMSRFAQLLAVWGLEQPYVIAHDIGGAVALGALLPGTAPIALLDGVGHLSPVEAPTAVNTHLANWLCAVAQGCSGTAHTPSAQTAAPGSPNVVRLPTGASRPGAHR